MYTAKLKRSASKVSAQLPSMMLSKNRRTMFRCEHAGIARLRHVPVNDACDRCSFSPALSKAQTDHVMLSSTSVCTLKR